MNILSLQKVYCIGIKGAGMTALAELLQRHGVAVSGSDTTEEFYTDAVLKRLKIPVKQPFAESNLDTSAQVIIHSSVYTVENNVEMEKAAKAGMLLYSYPEALGLLTRQKLTLAVCGTHGKTTTSALLAEMLRLAELAPSAIVGSEIKSWGGGALAGNGQYFVLEADEYQDKLSLYHPFGVVLTSVDWDHPDFFPTVGEYEAAFERFVARIPKHGFLVACGDEARVRAVATKTKVPTIFYGALPGSDVQVVDIKNIDPESTEGRSGIRQEFSLETPVGRLGPFQLQLAGKHNALNAAAVASVFLHLKLPLESLASSLASFAGTKRRFEQIGECQQALVFDDYAHHPDEIRVTLKAFRDLYPNRTLSVVFHPHTFTRTKALFEEFAESLGLADRVFLIDIYGSARETQGGVSSAQLAEHINRVFPEKARYMPDRAALVDDLRSGIGEKDLVVTMGAGDVWQIGKALVETA